VEDLLGILSFLSSTAPPTGNTAASWVFSVTAAASSAGTATSPRISRAWPISTPCASTSPAASSTPPNICATLRPVGFPRQRHHQHARLHRRHHLPGHHHPPAGRNFLRADPQPSTRTWAVPAPTCGPRPTVSGAARCEYACYDTQACATPDPGIPGRTASSGLPLQVQVQVRRLPQLLRGLHRPADMSFIGTWKDDIKIDQEAVQATSAANSRPTAAPTPAATGVPSTSRRKSSICAPPNCMWMEDGKLKIDNKECTRCMHCINVMPRALRIGDDRGCSILVGAKAPILDGAQMGSLLVPFIKVKSPTTRSRKSSKASGTGGWKKARTANVSAS
jgi:hypothetical protein